MKTNYDADEARIEVAEAARQLAWNQLVLGTAGNVSTKVGDLIAVTATGITLAKAKPEDVTLVDLDGRPHSGDLRPTSELQLHLGVYRTTTAHSVVHTHAPAAVSLSLIATELPPIHYQQLALGGSVPILPFAAFGTEELAEMTSSALREKNAAILSNHGTVTVGPSLKSAVENTMLLEWLCKVYLDAAAVDNPRALTHSQLNQVAQIAARIGYGTTHPITS